MAVWARSLVCNTSNQFVAWSILPTFIVFAKKSHTANQKVADLRSQARLKRLASCFELATLCRQ